MAEEQTGTVLSEEAQKAIIGAVKRLAGSELYRARLRRVLVNSWDPKVLDDFLALDDAILAIQRSVPKTSDEYEYLTRVRLEAFRKAEESAVRKLDARVLDQMYRWSKYLRFDRDEGETSAQVFESFYGPRY